ncbi:hypothetical protein GQ53DRAFT_8239 [Thozetella sp. PMI_491]|nr:hypothetical protein GQ53DRAFT_8239 [Thozetella sp. PMI_491]
MEARSCQPLSLNEHCPAPPDTAGVGRWLESSTQASLAQADIDDMPATPEAPLPRPPYPPRTRRRLCPDSNQDDDEPVSRDQLLIEVQKIYADLATIESKYVELSSLWHQDNRCFSAICDKLSDGERQSLTAQYSTLLQEYYDFALAPQKSLTNSALRRLIWKYEAPYRTALFSFSDLLDMIHNPYCISILALRALSLIESAEGKLLKWLEEIEDILDRIWKRFQRCLYQPLTYALVYLHFFSEFPDGIRHLCTTMPWTIWPALIVLWGVCWMFYPHPATDEFDQDDWPSLLRQLDRAEDAQESFVQTNLGTLPETNLEIESREDAFDISTPSVDEAFMDELWSSIVSETSTFVPDISNPAKLSQDTALSFSPFALSMHTINAEASLPLANSGSCVSSLGGSSLAASFSPSSLLAKPLSMTASITPQPIVESIAVPRLGPFTTNLSSFDSRSSTADVLSDTGQIAGNANLTASSSNPIRQAQPSPFRCSGCDRIFSRKDALQRHMREQKHAAHPNPSRDPSEFVCPYPVCKRSKTGAGFKRREKLEQHIRSSCKGRLRLTPWNQAVVTSTEITQSDDAASLPARQTSASMQEGLRATGSEDERLSRECRISVLQKLYQAEEEDLRMKEEECQRVRERLARLKGVIGMFRDGDAIEDAGLRY